MRTLLSIGLAVFLDLVKKSCSRDFFFAHFILHLFIYPSTLTASLSYSCTHNHLQQNSQINTTFSLSLTANTIYCIFGTEPSVDNTYSTYVNELYDFRLH
jgi:hypothetical protein